MVIETFRDGDAKPVYERLKEKGRMLPPGLVYMDSWVTEDLSRCFQLVECNDERLFEAWVAEWADLVDFEILPLVSGHDAGKLVLN